VGGLAINEVDDVVDLFLTAGNPLALMHCVSVYPTRTEDLQIDVVRQFVDRYPGVTIGYSGHEDPARPEYGGLALAKGAVLFERHFGVPTEDVKLNAYSLNPEQARDWISTTLRAAIASGLGEPRRPVEGERESLQSLRRGMYAKHTIPAGKTITENDILLAAPCFDGQFHAGKYYEVVDSFTPMSPIYPFMPIGLDVTNELPKSLLVSSVIARVEEALTTALVTVESETEVEISHQYGIQRFYEEGAVIVNVINRDYAKKLLIQFPGQNHPAHHHIKKEETFQVLHGEVDLIVDGLTTKLRPGQTKLIEPGQIHSFSTDTGVIIEEVSTTHVPGDSVYVDNSIPSDPTTRKTVLLTL
jgi:N-acetylneuraminate synthase